MRKPRIEAAAELRTILAYVILLALVAAALALVVKSGAVNRESDARLMLSFGLGLIAACAIASSLAFLLAIRHWLLAVSAVTAIAAALAIALGAGPLEGLAKIVFGASTGLWLALVITSVGQVLLIAGLIILVDFYSVFLGPTKKLVESGGPWIDYFTINLPVFGAGAVSRLGVSDIIFFSLFVGCAITFRLRRTLSALAMTMSFVATMMVGVKLNIGVPALPLLSIFFLLANGDVLYHRFLEEPDRVSRGGGSSS